MPSPFDNSPQNHSEGERPVGTNRPAPREAFGVRRIPALFLALPFSVSKATQIKARNAAHSKRFAGPELDRVVQSFCAFRFYRIVVICFS